jgi:hypothetical protein
MTLPIPTGAELLLACHRGGHSDALRLALGEAVELRARMDEHPPETVLDVISSMDRGLLECLVFEQVYRDRPEWHVEGWPAWGATAQG